MNAFDALQERGFIYQSTDSERLRARLGEGPVTFYVGFDPTADSLHIGHLLPVMAMRWLQKCGHRPIALVGGGTGMVGDPSGKTEARQLLTVEAVDANVRALQGQLARFLDFGEGRAELVNNADWLRDLRYIDFLRDIGRHFSVNQMLQAESVKQRLESGLSFLEFNYLLLQAYDFYILRRDRGCELQCGGQDQWGNIVAGTGLIRRLLGREAHALTFPLLLKGDGQKFGKTAAGAVWLDPERTSPYAYYQFWRNADDADLRRLLAFFTELPMAEVERLAAAESAAGRNRAKEILAFEAARLAHGAAAAEKAYLAAGAEFGFADPEGKIETSSALRAIRPDEAAAELPTFTVPAAELAAGIPAFKLFADCGLCASGGEARRLIKGGGASINGEKVADERRLVTAADLRDGAIVLKAGKKNLRRIVCG
ncbi:MAG: tyrosine--tRNA ligase [Lentisphaeria bacterium]|jgi:tyrosyl-tRNA synthetase